MLKSCSPRTSPHLKPYESAAEGERGLPWRRHSLKHNMALARASLATLIGSHLLIAQLVKTIFYRIVAHRPKGIWHEYG